MKEPATIFIAGIQTNLTYWHERTQVPNETSHADIAKNFPNLYRAIQFGLQTPKTAFSAILLFIQSLPFVGRHGNYLQWIPLYQQALQVCPSDQPVCKIRLFNQLGIAYRKQRQLRQAMICHQQALSLATEIKNDAQLGYTYLNLALVHLRLNELAEAEACGKKSLEFFQLVSGSYDFEIFNAWHALGLIAQEKGAFRLAEKHFKEALNAIDKTNLVSERAMAMCALANVQKAQKHYESAEKLFQEAMTLLGQTNDNLMGIRILLDLGSLYYEQEIWEKAENTFRKINTHYLRQHHQLNLLALTANNLGCSLWRQGKGQQADEILRYSAGIYETLADKLMWANVTHILGSIALEQGRFSIAQHAYNEAEKIASDYSDNFFAQNILKNIADFRAQLPTQKSRK